MWAIPPLVFAAFFFGFHADNPYNTALPDLYVHNALVQALATNTGFRALASAIATIAACGLTPTRLRPAAAVWLYPIAAFFLAAEWLVETRYLIVPFALWLAFREQRSKPIEYATLALWAALAVFIVAGTFSGRLFP
jgi:alpha-1,2-glucosyltransferase